MRPLNRRVSPIQAIALVAALGIGAFGSGAEPPPEPKRAPPPQPAYPPAPTKPREPTRAEILAAEKRARKAAKRKADRASWGPRGDLRDLSMATLLAEVFKERAERKAWR